MARQTPHLQLPRCPHCEIDKPTLAGMGTATPTHAHDGSNVRYWKTYRCVNCGGVLLTAAREKENGELVELYPAGRRVAEEIPARAREYLLLAVETKHAPPAAALMASGAVDAMLTARGLAKGSLAARIDQAAAEHLLTADMAAWAHHVRLEGNDQRHPDPVAPLATADEAAQAVEFALALAEYLFVLPARVTRGRKQSEAGS